MTWSWVALFLGCDPYQPIQNNEMQVSRLDTKLAVQKFSVSVPKFDIVSPSLEVSIHTSQEDQAMAKLVTYLLRTDWLRVVICFHKLLYNCTSNGRLTEMCSMQSFNMIKQLRSYRHFYLFSSYSTSWRWQKATKIISKGNLCICMLSFMMIGHSIRKLRLF